MADKLSISIRIGSRTYPMAVSVENEYALRKSAHELNEQIKSYSHRFKVKDGQDLLAMVAFDLIVEKNKHEQYKLQQEEELISKINQLQALLTDATNPDNTTQ